MTRTRLAPILAAAALVLTGCWPFDDASPSPSASASALSPAPSASPSPSPSPSPDCSTFGIVPGALDCLRTDMPIVGNPGQDMLVWDATNCSPDEGRWIPAPGEGQFSLNGQAGGNVNRIDIWDATLTTPEGIGRGSLVTDLFAAYPGIVAGTPSFETNIYWISNAHGYVVFETGAFDYETYETAPEQVVFIRILAPGVDPDYAVYASENIAGVCPLGV